MMTFLEQIDADTIEPQRLAASALDYLRAKPSRGQRWISTYEALLVLHFEAQVIAVAALNVAHGVALSEDDLARLVVAHGRIEAIVQEAIG